MRLKKFSCRRCGAPKVNAYTSPYIVCDFCGTLTDIDYSVGYQVWNNSADHTEKYINKKQSFTARSEAFLRTKDKENYYKETYDFWDYYYKHYPEYLPPTVTTQEKYDLYVKAAADMAVDTAFSNIQYEWTDKYNKAYSGLKYYAKDGENYVVYEQFNKMISYYMELCKAGFRICYDNPKYAIMNEIVPEDIHFKLKISQIAQVWVPYLEEQYVKEFLRTYNLVDEYTDQEKPRGDEGNCGHCNEPLFIPDGAIKVICPKCRFEEIITQTINCTSCGIENELPIDWKATMPCNSCGNQLQVIKPLFG